MKRPHLKLVAAVALTLISLNLSSANAAELQYSRVLTSDQRSKSPDFVRLPGWTNMEVVRNGTVDQDLANLVAAQPEPSQLKWLQLVDLDVKRTAIKASTSEIVFPFVVGIRYQEKGTVAQLYAQGTINTSGNIVVKIQNGAISKVEVIGFDDSQISEWIGRKIHLINQYDSKFVSGVVPKLLGHFFTQEAPLRALLGLNQAQNGGQPLP